MLVLDLLATAVRGASQTRGGGAMITGIEAVMRFFVTYLEMTEDADLVVSLKDTSNERLLAVRISDPDSDSKFAAITMPIHEARIIANMVEQTMHKFPSIGGLPNLILALRGGADLAEREP
jgi:hypothetical protein